MSSDDRRKCFDIGRTTSRAISSFERAVDGREAVPELGLGYHGCRGEYDSGNGGIMRLAPIPIYYFGEGKETARSMAKKSSMTTHASVECLESADLMSDVIWDLLHGARREDILKTPRDDFTSQKVRDISCKTFVHKTRNEIGTSGYVVHTLEAALWAFLRTVTFEDGMYELASMGKDVDTVCCVYGQIAGAYYGFNAIPSRWVNALQKKEMVSKVVSDLVHDSLPAD